MLTLKYTGIISLPLRLVPLTAALQTSHSARFQPTFKIRFRSSSYLDDSAVKIIQLMNQMAFTGHHQTNNQEEKRQHSKIQRTATD